jgi:hypothetical protein
VKQNKTPPNESNVHVQLCYLKRREFTAKIFINIREEKKWESEKEAYRLHKEESVYTQTVRRLCDKNTVLRQFCRFPIAEHESKEQAKAFLYLPARA